MIGLAVTACLLLVLWGCRIHVQEKVARFRAFMLGEDGRIHPGKWKSMLERWFPFTPARSVPFLIGLWVTVFVLGIGIAIIRQLWWIPLGGGVAAFAATWVGYAARCSWWKRMCREQMKETLRAISTAIRSGVSFPIALQRAALELTDPFQRLLLQAEKEIRLGMSEGEAFRRLMEQTGVPSFEAVSTLIELTIAKGGKLAHVLDDIAVFLEEEDELLADLRSETASYRMSAYGLPILLLGLLFWFRSTILPLLEHSWFAGVFAAGLLLMGIGVVLSIRIVQRLDV